MASLMGARRRAEQFSDAVESRTPIDEVPGDLRALVDMVGAMRELPEPAPRPQFAAQLREQLMAEAQTTLAPATPLALPPRRRGARERRLTAAAAVFTLVGGTAGLAAAAQQALPGEALYPIKRGIEDAQLSIQSDPEGRGRNYLDQAASRLEEAERLVQDEATSSAVAETVDTFVVQAVAGADLLLTSFEENGRAPEGVQDLRQFAADSTAQLKQLAESAPSDITDELARAAVVLQRIDQQAASTCDQCSDLPSLELPVLMAQAAEISRAMEAVRSQELDNDHPSLELTPRRSQPAPAESEPREQSASGSSGTTGEQTPEPARPPALGGTGDTGGSTLLPRTPQKALEGVDDATGGLLDNIDGASRKATDEVKSGVDGLVEDSPLGGLTGQ